MDVVIETKALTKTYQMGQNEVHALRGLDLSIERGEFVAIMGQSGSGKSTFMNLIGCLDEPTSGEYFLDSRLVSGLSKYERAAVRNKKIGFVFQGFNLLARTSALENVMLPMVYDRARGGNPRKLAIDALARVQLADRMDHEPNQLSGGQQQRVAIARALVNRPAILLADEPTGNLDSHTSNQIMALFQELNEEGITIILVTHEPEIAQYAKRIVFLRDGELHYDVPVENRGSASQALLDTAQHSTPSRIPSVKPGVATA